MNKCNPIKKCQTPQQFSIDGVLDKQNSTRIGEHNINEFYIIVTTEISKEADDTSETKI